MKVKVPATSANLGPGFDCIGIALNLYNEFELIDRNNINEKNFEKENLADKAYKHFFEKTKTTFIDKKVKISGDVPISRGLGSSATCIIGGILLANEISNLNLSDEKLIDIALDLENHPDNLTPALIGGIVLNVKDEKNKFIKIKSKTLNFLAFIPDFLTSTEKAREILPKNYSREDVVYNISHAMLFINSIKDGNITKNCFYDKIHQPYRKNLIDEYEKIEKIAFDNGAKGVFISGSGSTIGAISDENFKEFDIKKYNLKNKWKVLNLKIENNGAKIIKD